MMAVVTRFVCLPVWLAVTAMIAVWPAPGEAQLQRGAIRGVARDASGALLPRRRKRGEET